MSFGSGRVPTSLACIRMSAFGASGDYVCVCSLSLTGSLARQHGVNEGGTLVEVIKSSDFGRSLEDGASCTPGLCLAVGLAPTSPCRRCVSYDGPRNFKANPCAGTGRRAPTPTR